MSVSFSVSSRLALTTLNPLALSPKPKIGPIKPGASNDLRNDATPISRETSAQSGKSDGLSVQTKQPTVSLEDKQNLIAQASLKSIGKQAAIDAAESAASNAVSDEDMQSAIAALEAAKKIDTSVSFAPPTTSSSRPSLLEFSLVSDTSSTSKLGKLKLADLNDEAANLVSLRARLQIAEQAIAAQDQQALLDLYS